MNRDEGKCHVTRLLDAYIAPLRVDTCMLLSSRYLIHASNNAEKTQEQKNGERRGWRTLKRPKNKRTARDGETGRSRWQTGESCRERSDLVEEASLSLHLSLGTSSKVVKVLSKVVEYLGVLVPVCDMCQEGIVVSVNGEGEW
jgi:hypothetical protein